MPGAYSGDMRAEDIGQAAEHLADIAAEAADTGPVLLSRPGGAPVVVVAAETWERASAALRAAEAVYAQTETDAWLRVGATADDADADSEHDLDGDGVRARCYKTLAVSAGS